MTREAQNSAFSSIKNSASMLLPQFKGFKPIDKLENHYTVARDLVSNNEIEKH